MSGSRLFEPPYVAHCVKLLGAVMARVGSSAVFRMVFNVWSFHLIFNILCNAVGSDQAQNMHPCWLISLHANWFALGPELRFLSLSFETCVRRMSIRCGCFISRTATFLYQMRQGGTERFLH